MPRIAVDVSGTDPSTSADYVQFCKVLATCQVRGVVQQVLDLTGVKSFGQIVLDAAFL